MDCALVDEKSTLRSGRTSSLLRPRPVTRKELWYKKQLYF